MKADGEIRGSACGCHEEDDDEGGGAGGVCLFLCNKARETLGLAEKLTRGRRI